jgi:hypothetical protein
MKALGTIMPIDKVSYSHDSMIDVLIARPMVTQREVARHFGYTESWISQVMSSDSFKKRFAERRDGLVDPMITKNLEHLFEGVGRLSLSVISENLEASRNPDLAIRALEITRKGLGLGNRDNRPLIQNFVAMLPPKAESYAEWIGGYAPPSAQPQDSSVASRTSGSLIEGDYDALES